MAEEWNEHIMNPEVLKNLGINDPSQHPNFWVYPQRVKYDSQIKEILGKCGGKPKEWFLCTYDIKNKKVGISGVPDYTIRYKHKDIVLLIETKTQLNSHQSSLNLQKEIKPKDYNLDGLLYFAEFFKEEFDVLGLAITGESPEKENWEMSFFTWPKGQQKFDLKSIHKERELLPVEEYFSHFLPKENKSNDSNIKEIRDTAKELNEIIYQGLGFAESEKPFFISACLIALKNEDFHNFAEKKNIVISCRDTINNEIDDIVKKEKANAEKYKSLKIVLTGTIESNKKLASISKNKENSFVNILTKINQKVLPFLDEGDIIGEFYHEFLKYSTGDGKNLGIVLTPSHIADLFCEIALKLLYPDQRYEKRKFTKEDKILDICCGTGTFLVNAFKKEVEKDKVFGVEIKSEPYNLALTNMILWGDGKSNIFQGDCFDKEIEKKIKNGCNIAFLNPPYSQKKKKTSEGKSEIEFILQACNLLKEKGWVIAIVPLSAAIGTKYEKERKKLMEKHTLKAVMTMPPDLFSGNESGSHTCIMVWEVGRANKESSETWLANWKDDGFTTLKVKRFDKDNKWETIKENWVNSFSKETEDYISTFKKLTYKDCWLADAYVETDYSSLTKDEGKLYFEKTIRDYLAFLISNFHSPRQTDNLDISNWKYFYLNEKESYFRISRGKWKEALTKTSPKILFDQNSVIPIISSSKENNGVDNFVKKSGREDIKTNSKNLITIANNGSIGESFFQSLEFQATSDVTILELVNQELNEYIAFFLCSIIKMERFRYSWGRKWGLEEMRNSRIKLPQDKEGNPDWKFMENHSKKIFSKVKESIYQMLESRERERERERAKVNNSVPKWEGVKLNDYFHIEGTKTTKKEDVKPGEFAYISNKNTSNGYECSSFLGTEDGNVISVSDFGAGAFYQETRFSCTYHVQKIYPKDKSFNKYTVLFITTLLNWGASKYSYGRIRNLENIRGEKILIPIKNQKIDWEWIENFMKDLYKKVSVDFEKELERIS